MGSFDAADPRKKLGSIDAPQPRHERERAYHDERFAHEVRTRSARYYEGAAGGERYLQLLAEITRDRDVLELGCGRGTTSRSLARDGARVLGVDISPVAVRTASRRAREHGEEGVRFEEMNAEALDLEHDSFDVVCGSGILHHVDLDRTYGETARVLRATGEAVFHEPLAHNPLIGLYRRLTPQERSTDEHPLRFRDLERARGFFGDVTFEFYDLTSLAAHFMPRAVRAGLVPRLRALDQWTFRRLPAARRYAWVAVLRLRNPRTR
jgi:SAM-dependent methyltransferase